MSDPADSDCSAVGWARAQLAGWDVPAAFELLDRPHVATPADVVADWAGSGAVALTGFADGPPIVPPGAAATAARGAQLAFAALAGEPDKSLGDWSTLLGERAALAGLGRRAPWTAGGSCRAVACSDGWVVVNLARDDDVASVPALLEVTAEELTAEEMWRLLDREMAASCVADLLARAELLGLPLAAVPAPGAWVAADPLTAGEASQPLRRTEVATGPRRPAANRPLVLDFSALWAGPLCARLLGAIGARVVKVEWSSRPDGARRGPVDFYDALHAGHDSVCLDPAAGEDRALLGRLLDQADIVIEAARPRALAGLGVDALEICGRGSTTWVSITAFGRRSPLRLGFGDDVAMSAGLVAWTDDARPIPCGDAIADPLTGLHAAVAALASYQTGGSRLIDIAMCDVAAATVAWRPGVSGVARLDRRGSWVVDGVHGPVAVAAPRAVAPNGRAARLGADTDRWRRS